MTGSEFRAWRARLGLSLAGASLALGCSKTTLVGYEKGGRIPRYIALACSALAFGLPPVGEAGQARDRAPPVR